MDMNFSVFQEPRGVMRIFQFVFAICAFGTICNYTGTVHFNCEVNAAYEFDYPFNMYYQEAMNKGANTTCHPTPTINGNYASDAKYFVATGVIAMLYSLGICVVYTKFDQLYKSNNQIPLLDFLLSVFIAVLWLSSSACWANSLTGIKHTTDPEYITWDHTTELCKKCSTTVNGFNTLNISVLLGFLNFFLWASDLWFLYKETSWFQNTQIASPTEN